MKQVEKVIGRAGTGKTYYLIEKLSALLDSGVKPYEIGMVTFTRTAANIFKERILKKHPEYSKNDFKYFGTMHATGTKLIGGWKEEYSYNSKQRREFVKLHYPDFEHPIEDYPEDEYRLTSVDRDNIKQNSMFKALEGIDGCLRSLDIKDFNFNEMQIRTGRTLEYPHYNVSNQEFSEKYNKIVLKWRKRYEMIDPVMVIEFSDNYKKFKLENNLLDYTDIIEICLNEGLSPNIRFLFCDEFQDFNTLQYKLYQLWRDDPYVEHVCIAGDDAQTVTRFGGANAKYFISEPCTVRTVLPKTYRHGAKIFYDAQKYIDKMEFAEECDVLPRSDIDGDVVKVYGDEWKNHLNFSDDETCLILAWSKKWIREIKSVVDEILPGTLFTVLGNDGKETRVLEHYNIIASLERGEEVRWDKVKKLFSSQTNCLPSMMLYKEITSTLMGVKSEIIKKKIIKNIKSEIREYRYDARPVYNKKYFAKDFMTIDWDGELLLKNIKDIELLENIQDMFPSFVEHVNSKRIGTIHKSKGDEADTVILFMSVPYPAVKNMLFESGKDDILHTFYVGKTRPRTKLIEVYGYLKNGDDLAPAPLDILG